MSERYEECRATVTLSEADMAYLGRDPQQLNEVDDWYRCHLQRGHPGDHIEYAQTARAHFYTSPDATRAVNLWVQWSDEDNCRIIIATDCPAVADPDPNVDGRGCMLVDGHPGPHHYYRDL